MEVDIDMKKLVTLVLMLVMMCSLSLTAFAKGSVKSPSGKPVEDGGSDVIESPKTGDSDIVLYGLGSAAVLLASGAVVIRKKAV